MNRPLGRLGAAATLGQHCPQMTQRRCTVDQIFNIKHHQKIIEVNSVRVHLQVIKSLIEGIIRTGEQVLDTEHHKNIIKVNDVRVHIQGGFNVTRTTHVLPT